jgi:tRNA-(ms[2]io[6]A)-hydroxylase
MAEKRRLPVIQPPSSNEEEAEPRPPWQWVGFGVVAIFAAWLPLAWLAQLVGLRLASAHLGTALQDLAAIQERVVELGRGERARIWAGILLPQALALALACAGGGYVVGRWGRPAGPREAAIAGGLVAALSSAAACGAPGVGYVPLAMALISIPFAALGARWGRWRSGTTSGPT